jgi:TolB protein
MRKFLSFFLFFTVLFSEDLEVKLATRGSLPPLYISHVQSKDPDWRSYEELREALEFDLNAGGLCSVVPRKEALEESLSANRDQLDRNRWKKEKIPYCVALRAHENRLEAIVFNIEKGTSKRYPSTSLERRSIHKLADAIQKDLFGQEGIASLKLIYTLRTENEEGPGWLSEVWLCDADGANPRQVTQENSYCLSPSFIKSDQFFYTSEKSGQTKIYRASLSNPKGELLVELRGNQALPALSKNGKQIAFITDVAGRPDLFIQNLDSHGKARQLFSAPRATQASPAFSPDGKQLAFVSDKDGPPRIYVMSLTDPKTTVKTHPKLLTKKNRENTSPSWSPDGKKLAYSAKVDGVRQIWIYDFLTDEETPLTTGPENKENPSWAPDSFHLVYNTESEERCELYLIHLNGGEPIQISKGPGQKRFASWEIRH